MKFCIKTDSYQNFTNVLEALTNTELAKITSETGNARNITEQGGVATQGRLKLQCWEMLIRLATDVQSDPLCVTFSMGLVKWKLRGSICCGRENLDKFKQLEMRFH